VQNGVEGSVLEAEEAVAPFSKVQSQLVSVPGTFFKDS
jgi:hypothetical protein